MGLLVPAHEVHRVGLTLPNAYLALSKHPVMLSPDPAARGTYHAVADYSVWASQQVREEGGGALATACVRCVCGDGGVGLYAAMYAQLKEDLQQAVDAQA
jgi:hypothetical protein